MAQVPVSQKNQGSQLPTRNEHPLERLHRDFERLFERMWGGWLGPPEQDFDFMRPLAFDVTEDDREICVRAEMPGFEENEIDVRLGDNMLTIKAEKQQKEDGREEYRTFHRTVTLPTGIDDDKVQASYRNGVLELHIPRAEAAQQKRISIQGQKSAGAQQGGQPRSAQQPSTQAGAQQTGTTGAKSKK